MSCYRVHHDVDVCDFPSLINVRIVKNNKHLFIVHEGSSLYVYDGKSTKPEILKPMKGKIENPDWACYVAENSNGLTGLSGFVLSEYDNNHCTGKGKVQRSYSHPEIGTINVTFVDVMGDKLNPIYVGEEQLCHAYESNDDPENHHVWMSGNKTYVHPFYSMNEEDVVPMMSVPSQIKELTFLSMDTDGEYEVIGRDSNQPDVFNNLTIHNEGRWQRNAENTSTYKAPTGEKIVGVFAADGDPWFVLSSGKFAPGCENMRISEMDLRCKVGKVTCFHCKGSDVLFMLSRVDGKLYVVRKFLDSKGDPSAWGRNFQSWKTTKLFFDQPAEEKDLVFVTNDDLRVYAHSCVMDVLEGTVFAGGKEFREKQQVKRVCVRESTIFQHLHIDQREAMLMIEFCYFGQIDKQPLDVLLKLAVAAGSCLMDSLSEYIEPWLFKELENMTKEQMIYLSERCNMLRDYIVPKLRD